MMRWPIFRIISVFNRCDDILIKIRSSFELIFDEHYLPNMTHVLLLTHLYFTMPLQKSFLLAHAQFPTFALDLYEPSVAPHPETVNPPNLRLLRTDNAPALVI